MHCTPSMVGVVPGMVGVVPSYTEEYTAACTVHLAWLGGTWHGRGGTQLYSGVQRCMYCTPSMVGWYLAW